MKQNPKKLPNLKENQRIQNNRLKTTNPFNYQQ